MINRLLYFLILLLYSCDFYEEAIPVSNLDKDNLTYVKFDLNTSLSDTIHNINEFGGSSLLYAGQLNDSDYVYSIFKFDAEIFQDYNLCNEDSVSFGSTYLVFDLFNKYPLTLENSNQSNNSQNNSIIEDFSTFQAYWLDQNDFTDGDGQKILDLDWQEEDKISFSNITFGSSYVANEYNDNRLKIEKYQGKYYIDITDKLINIGDNVDCQVFSDKESCNIANCIWNNNVCQNTANFNLCDINSLENNFILLASNPANEFLYEIVSSEYISDISNTEPYLNLNYLEYEEITKTSNKFIINDTHPEFGSILHISDTLLSKYNSIFVGNFLDSDSDVFVSSSINDSVIWSDLDCEFSNDFCIDSYDLINESSDTEEKVLLNLHIDLTHIENYESNGISFWLDKIHYLINTDDPNGDNWIDLNGNNTWDENEGTENNQLFDEEEFYLDYGKDHCPDIYEDGSGDGCICIYPYIECDEALIIYNAQGTENNNQYDDGEIFNDYGSDNCLDDNETGAVLNSDGTINSELSWKCGECEINEINISCDNDPNNDNYNDDPSQDNWIDLNDNNTWDENEGTELNGIYNFNDTNGDNIQQSSESGELFLDFGLDGLSQTNTGYMDADGTENNGIYDFYDSNGDGIQQPNELGEPFFDYGIDGIENSDEIGYNIDGTEGNEEWDVGEFFYDCGMDADCNDLDTTDDWNIDPNNDFWFDCGSDNICPEDDNYNEPDSNGTERNDIWDNAYCENNAYYEKIDCENNSFIWFDAEVSEGNSTYNEGEFFQDYGNDQTKDDDELFILNQKVNVNDTDTTFYEYSSSSVSYYPKYINQESDDVKIWISKITNLNDEKLNIEVSIINNVDLLGIEFRLNHLPYSVTEDDWIKKVRNIAKINNISYIRDASLFNNNLFQSNNSLYMNDAYGISSKLNFEGLANFIEEANQNGYIINEENSKLKLNFNKSDEFILKSDFYRLNFNEIDTASTNLIFTYFISGDTDSIIVPIGNLLQNYVNDIYKYNEGIGLELEVNQNPPIFNFNNILIDTLKPPSIQVYYYK